MISQKSQQPNLAGGGWFKQELKLLGLFLGLISFSNSVLSNNTSALFVPTLSASVGQANLQVNGNQVINSIDKTTEIPFNFTVNTNNRTGYTATLSAETENTALNNAESSTGSKINSIDTALSLNSFPVDAWGYKFDSGTNFLPIPALSAPVQIVQTTVKTNGNESNQLSIGMKLSQNLESGTYSNALVLSFISNPYTPKAIMVGGIDFQGRLARFDSNPNHVDNHPELPTYPNLVHIKRERSVSSVPTNAINLEADNSEAEIKAWYDSAAKTVYWYSSAEKVYLNPDCTNMFSYFTGMTDVDLSSFDTSEVENMNAMFYLNFALEKLDVTGFDTSRVKDMSAMFRSLTSLKELNITNFNTSKVETMQQMFYGMNKVKNLDISHFDTRKVKLMNGMFGYMYNLESLSLNNFDTSRVTDMSQMFASDVLIKTLDLSSFDTSNVVDMSAMFVGLTNLVNLNISSFNTSKVTNMAGMFMINPKIEQLDLSHFDTRNVTSMVSMFYDMPKLKSVNVRNFDTSKVEDMSHMFSHDDELTELDLSSFTTPKVKRFKGMFNSESPINKLTNIYVSHDWDTTAAKGPDVGAQDNIYIFRNRNNLVGGNGWRSSLPENVGLEALRIDRPGAPGYFTLKP